MLYLCVIIDANKKNKKHLQDALLIDSGQLFVNQPTTTLLKLPKGVPTDATQKKKTSVLDQKHLLLKGEEVSEGNEQLQHGAILSHVGRHAMG